MIKNIGSFICKTLDKNDAAEVDMYERAFFKAFFRTEKNLDRIWDIDPKEKKIRTKISYESQEIIIVKSPLRIYAALSINFSTTDRQFERIGFKVDENGKGLCEVLQLFSMLDGAYSKAFFEIISDNAKYLADKGISLLYATCSAKRVKQYTQIGFSAIQELEFYGEQEFLLVKNIE